MNGFWKLVLVAIGVVAVASVAGCGGSGSSSSSTSASPASGASGGGLRVLAASSLTGVFPKLAAAFGKANGGAKVAFEFAGSDELATQLEEGAKADVYAAASTKYPDKLAAEGKVAKPVPFAANTLVLATPTGSSKAFDLESLSTPGLKLVIGAAGVPVGDYTRKVLTALDVTEGAGWSAAVLKNVVSEEQSVKSIVAKLASGDADAGFVYITDVRAADGKLKAITIPPAAKPSATYPIAVVTSSNAKGLAEKWIAFVLSADGQKLLTDAGFGAAPAS